MYPRGLILYEKLIVCTRTGLFFLDMTIGEYIKDKRKQFKLTQIELAERSGVGVRFVRELERGKTTVQLDKVNQVLELFGETLYPKRIND